jgi:hypothetical protein
LPDSNQKGVAHRHPRPMPENRFLPKRKKAFDPMLSSPTVPEREFILPDNETFGHLDLRWLVDEIDNSGDE